MAQDLSPLLPEKGTVWFPGRRCAGIPSNVVPPFYKSEVNLSDITFTNSDVAGQPQGVPNTTAIFHDSCVALFIPSVTDPTNKQHLDDLAKQIFQDYCDWRSVSFDIVVSGIAAFVPTALADIIEFNYTAEDSWTRQQTQPWNGEPIEFQHYDPVTYGCSDRNNHGDVTEKVPYIEVYTGPESCTGGRAIATATVTDGEVTSVDLFTGVLSISITNAGSGYTTAPTIAITGGGGTGATAIATTDGDAITGIVMTGPVTSIPLGSGGTGYTGAPTISFTGGGGGSGAAATATLTDDKVTSISLTMGGSDYTSAPTVVFSGGGGTGASATASITTGGSGYTSAPSVGATGGGGSGATFLAVISDNGGYTSVPQVAFSHIPGDGTGAAATATVVSGAVTAVTVTDGGEGYSDDHPPLVSFYGGGTSLQRTISLIAIEDGRLVQYFSRYQTVGG